MRAGLEGTGYFFFLGNLNTAYKLKVSLYYVCIFILYVCFINTYEYMFAYRLSGRFS